MSNSYTEETKPLFKMLRTEAFRFVVVNYNHYSIVQRIEQDLRALFPERPILKVDAQKQAYHNISEAYTTIDHGFFFIENFDILLKEERNSLGLETKAMAIENQRRRHITAGLNLRRDRFAKKPIALFIFIPATSDAQYTRIMMEKMPDLWSFRSFILDLEQEIVVDNTETKLDFSKLKDFYLEDKLISVSPEQEIEFKRLMSTLAKTPKSEIAYRLTLFPQIVDLGIEIGKYKEVLEILEEWEKSTEDLGIVWFAKGDIYSTIGKTDKALLCFEKSLEFFTEKNDKENMAMCYRKLGDVAYVVKMKELGDGIHGFIRGKVLIKYYEKSHKLIEDLYLLYPNSNNYKFQFAQSLIELSALFLDNIEYYSKLFKKGIQLLKELFEEFPKNEKYKLGLVEAHETEYYNDYDHQSYLEDDPIETSKELMGLLYEICDDYPYNNEYKCKLADYLSEIGKNLLYQNKTKKAIEYLEKSTIIYKELHEIFPKNHKLRLSLADTFLSYGDAEFRINNVTESLIFYELGNKLYEDIVKMKYDKLEVKYQFLLSYAKLGNVYYLLQNNSKAFEYYNKCINHKFINDLLGYIRVYIDDDIFLTPLRLAGIYAELGNYDKATEILINSCYWLIKSDWGKLVKGKYLYINYYFLGNYYNKSQNHKMAKKYLKKCIVLGQKVSLNSSEDEELIKSTVLDAIGILKSIEE